MTVKIINFGSLNVDHVYQVNHLVSPGETEASLHYSRYAGGKGCNQSIAISRAGVRVTHAGMVGRDGVWLRDLLKTNMVDTHLIDVIDEPSGHAIVQVDAQGDNSIILYQGANAKIDSNLINSVIQLLNADDILVLQNEINDISSIIKKASSKRVRIFFNPAPMTSEVAAYPLAHVNHIFLNKIEGQQLTGESDEAVILNKMANWFPAATIVLTLGDKGVAARCQDEYAFQAAYNVNCIDSTAAGDTFIGYYTAEYARGSNLATRLKIATVAASICVSTQGSADSIPVYQDVAKKLVRV